MSTDLGPNNYSLRRTALAAVRTATGEDTFFQDFDGNIRKTRYDDAKGYSGGDKASIIYAASDAKYQTSLAAFSSADTKKAVSA